MRAVRLAGPPVAPRGLQLVHHAPVLVELPGDFRSTECVTGALFPGMPAGDLAGLLLVSSVYCSVLTVGPREVPDMTHLHTRRPTTLYCTASTRLTFDSAAAGGVYVLPCVMTEEEKARRCGSLRAFTTPEARLHDS